MTYYIIANLGTRSKVFRSNSVISIQNELDFDFHGWRYASVYWCLSNGAKGPYLGTFSPSRPLYSDPRTYFGPITFKKNVQPKPKKRFFLW